MPFSYRKIILLFVLSFLLFMSSCSIHKQISKQAANTVLKDTAIATGNIGICIYEPATNKYWYNYNSTHYFIPASNTKLFTLYAGMKYLGDSLVGIKYLQTHDTVLFIPAADPTFLHPDFPQQPVYNFLNKNNTLIYGGDAFWNGKALGMGWAWDDFNSDYMAERSEFPIYGNLIKIKTKKTSTLPGEFILSKSAEIIPKYFYKDGFFENQIEFPQDEIQRGETYFKVKRGLGGNKFYLTASKVNPGTLSIPFSTESPYFIKDLLVDTLGKKIYRSYYDLIKCIGDCPVPEALQFDTKYYNIIHSQPTDSLFKPMMHRSDNFFAEQTLLMVSNEKLGYMSDEKIIDSLLKSDLKDVPQRPKWVDGSGLSRYNLFTPQSFVYILNKLRNDFTFERLKVILPTGGEGTINNYFKTISGNIYAKTGTLSNNCALSGYLLTNKGKLLIFSVLANNYITGATPVRRAVEQFLEGIQKKY